MFVSIGVGETRLKLAQSALQKNFDGTAVDHISKAIEYLTRYIEHFESHVNLMINLFS